MKFSNLAGLDPVFRKRGASTLALFCLLFLRPALSPASTTIISGTVIDVNFNADKNPYDLGAVKTGVAAIGQTTNDFWNVCSRSGVTDSDFQTFVTVSNLLTADGTLTTAGLTLANAPGAWDNGVADPMFNSYLYPFDGGNLTLTVTNLPVGAYDFYLYGHGQTQNGTFNTPMNGVYQLSSGGLDYGTKSTTSGNGWANTDWQEGQQYVVFHGVQVSDPSQPVVITGLPGVCGEALIAGMQITSAAEVTPVAPVITTNPASQTVFAGANATFTIGANGTSPLSFQWLENGDPISQATNNSLTLTNVQLGQSGHQFSVVVSNNVNSTNSAAAVLTVNPIPNAPVTLLNVNFFADKNPYGLGAIKTGFAAIGQTANDYWNGCSRDGASSTDWLNFVTVNNLTNADGTVSAVGLTLANAPGAWGNGVADAMYDSYLYPFDGGNLTVTITNLPVGSYDIYIYGHGSTQGGYHDLNGVYQLTSGGVDYGTLSTATNGTGWDSTLWLEGQQYVMFRGVTVNSSAQPVVVTGLPGIGGEALIAGMQIAPAAPIIPTAPVILNQPMSRSVFAGANATFSVGAAGTPPLNYQWLENGVPVSTATNSTYTVTNVQLGQSGYLYSVIVSNSVNSTNSTAALLTVSSGISGSLLNVNFNADKNPYDLGAVKTGFAAIGQTTNDFWNVCSRDGADSSDFLSFVAVSNLLTADGTLTTVGLTLANAPGAWDNGVADAMFNSYLYPFDGGNITLTITNLPAGTYDFYLYGHGNASQGGANGVYQLSSGTNNYGTLSTASNGTAWASTDWQEGQQYVVFRSVQINDPSLSVVVTGLPGVSGEALIAGMQITQEAQSAAVINHVAFGRPALKMTTAYGNLVLSWPVTASGFVLESSETLSPANWTAVNAVPVTNGNQITVTLPLSASDRLYRLRHP